MNKLFLAIAGLVMLTGCAATAPLETASGKPEATISSESRNMTSYGAMMEAAISISDMQTAKSYAVMAKDSMIRLKGLGAKTLQLIDDAVGQPNRCGLDDATINETRKNIKTMVSTADEALRMYAKVMN